MRKYLIATHGTMGKGIVNTLEIILGKQDNLSYIAGYTEECREPGEEILRFVQENQDTDVVIFTDLFGGSVNNAAMPLSQRDNVFLVTGVNLALVMEVLLADQETETQEVIENALVSGREAIQYFHQNLVVSEEEDF